MVQREWDECFERRKLKHQASFRIRGAGTCNPQMQTTCFTRAFQPPVNKANQITSPNVRLNLQHYCELIKGSVPSEISSIRTNILSDKGSWAILKDFYYFFLMQLKHGGICLTKSNHAATWKLKQPTPDGADRCEIALLLFTCCLLLCLKCFLCLFSEAAIEGEQVCLIAWVICNYSFCVSI